MRSLLIAALAAFIAVPAAAADSVADQAAKAFDIFAGALAQPDFAGANYGRRTLSDIAGMWVNLGGPAPGSGIESYGADMEKACGGPAALTLAAPNALTLTVTAKPLGVEFSQSYTLVAGAIFAERTEPEAYFKAIGLGPDKVGPEFDRSRAVALSVANGMVQLYRPSADILVLARGGSYPTVLARCPKS